MIVSGCLVPIVANSLLAIWQVQQGLGLRRLDTRCNNNNMEVL